MQGSRVCVYYCRTYYKAVRGGGRRRVDDMCYDRRRADGTREEPGTLTQGAPVFKVHFQFCAKDFCFWEKKSQSGAQMNEEGRLVACALGAGAVGVGACA